MQINFWATRKGAYLSHNRGLSPDQIQFLRTLREGDRLVIYLNEPDPDGNAADMTMKKALFTPKA